MFCLGFGIIGIPFMLSVLADVGGLMAEGIEYAWMVNKDRIKFIAEKLKISKQRHCHSSDILHLSHCQLNTFSDPEEEGEGGVALEGSSASVQGNIITMVGVVGVLGSFFALGALLFTLWEVLQFSTISSSSTKIEFKSCFLN